MTDSIGWQQELKFMVDFMRELSLQTDPQVAADLYGRRLREGKLIVADGFLAVSRRELKFPEFRITRSSTWKEKINPWFEKERLPLLSAGLLREIVYSEEPVIMDDLPSRYSADDPAAIYFEGMQQLVAIPQYDNGEALNWSVTLTRDVESVPKKRLPMLVLQANLWGRSVLSSVLREELKRTYDALDRELKTVGEIQRSLLPSTLPNVPGLDLAASYETSQRAGGDYYDFFALPEHKWGIFIADVSGHGIPAAVVMAITHAIAHTRPTPLTRPGDFLAYLNATLRNRYTGETGSFVTAFYAVYDPATMTLTYAAGGHPTPRLVRDHKVSGLGGRFGLPLGIDTPTEYLEYEIELRSGDKLLLYTDGVSEAFSPSGEQYGVERLDAACLASRGDATALLRSVQAELKKHSGDRSVGDDRTLLAIHVR